MTEGPPSSGASEASRATRSGRFAGVPGYMKTAFRWAIGFAALAFGVSALA